MTQPTREEVLTRMPMTAVPTDLVMELANIIASPGTMLEQYSALQLAQLAIRTKSYVDASWQAILTATT